MARQTVSIRKSAFVLLAALTWASPGIEASAAGQNAISAPVTRLQYSSSMPSWEFFEGVLRRDAGWWFGNRYYKGSLGRVELVEGTISSGYWSAKGTYEYVSGWDDKSYYGWVIFRFRNGSLDCLVYHDFQNTCRAPH